MLEPRLIFQGDLSLCTPWVGLAKKLARQSYRMGILNKTWLLNDAVSIRVENSPGASPTHGLSKVFIIAPAQGGYQFINTGPLITYQTVPVIGRYQAQGSAVFVPYPAVKADGSPVDWSTVKAIPTGSTLEALPSGTPAATEIQTIPWVRNLVQVELIPEPVWVGVNTLTSKTLSSKLANAWVAQSGDVFGVCWRMPTNTAQVSDVGYDLPPTPLTSRNPTPRMPDADWPDNAARVTVNSSHFGTRSFIVLVDGSSHFLCWPDQYDSKDSLVPPGSPYLNQAIKDNVPEAQVQRASPPFPAWVHPFPGGYMRRDQDFQDGLGNYRYSGEPRYVWRFHPQGNKVVGVVLHREAFSGDVYAQMASPPGGVPLKEEVIGPAQIDTSWLGDKTVPYGDLQVDTYGWVEFALTITITGPNKENFDFAMALSRSQPANDTLYPIAADYLAPLTLKDGWAGQGIAGTPGDLIVANFEVVTDAAATDFITLDCGYKDALTNYTRQTWLHIINIETSQELFTLLGRNQPAGWSRTQIQASASPLYRMNGELRYLNLALLSWSLWYDYSRYTWDLVPYATTTGDNSVPINVVQRWESDDMGVRMTVLGKTVQQQRWGTDLGLFTVLDGITRATDAVPILPNKTGTRWLANQSVYTWQYTVWLLSRVASRYYLYLADTFADAMTALLADFGGHAGLAQSYRDYTPSYWTDVIVPAMQTIRTNTLAMEAAGDLPAPGGSSHDSHATAAFLPWFYTTADWALQTSTNTQYNPRIYDYPIGAEWLRNESAAFFNSQATFDLVPNPAGFYATALSFRYPTGAFPAYSFFLAQHSGLPATDAADASRGSFTDQDAWFSTVNQPAASLFQLASLDVVGHVQGGTTTHSALYQQAYQHSETPFIPVVTVTVNGTAYSATQRLYENLDGTWYYTDYGVFDRALHLEFPRPNGAGLFS